MRRYAWSMAVFSLVALAGAPLFGDPQRGGREGGGRNEGDRGGVEIEIPGVNIQPPRAQTPNVQPRVDVNQGNPRQPGRRGDIDGGVRIGPPQGDDDRRGRAGGSVGAGAQIPGPGIRIGPGGVDVGVGGRVGPDRRGRVDVDGRGRGRADFDGRGRNDGRFDFNDRFLGGISINLGNRDFNIAGGVYQPSYNRHRWYGGYWNFDNWRNRGWGQDWNGGGWGYGDWGGRRGYWGRPAGWGLGAWGLGSLTYRSGYLGYSNPYYVDGGAYNYGRPIPVTYYTDYTERDFANDPADDMLNSAIAAFRRTDYKSALDIVDRAISQFPDDAVLHEFRALVLFAKADYHPAAATIHSVLAIGPGWDWSTMNRLYTDVSVYTAQLRALEFHTKQNPDDAAGLFLLAYHYLCTGHPDAAARKLRNVIELQPNDRVAAELLRMISSGSTGEATAGRPAATDPRPAVPQPPAAPVQPPAETAGRPVSVATLAGTWSARREDGSKFELRLNPDSTFTWQFSRQNIQEKFSGMYTLEGTVLALQRKDGGSLIGNVTALEEGRFRFKLLGGPPEDTGLEFVR